MNDFVNKLRKHLEREHVLLKTNRADVNRVNGKLVVTLFGAGLVAFCALILVSLFRDNYATVEYLPVVAVLVIGLIVGKRLSGHTNLTPFYLAGFIVAALWCGYSSGYLWPNELSVMALAVFFLFAVTLLESTATVTFCQCLLLAVYLLVIAGGKNPDYFFTEAVNGILFTLLGAVVGLNMRAIRLENFELKRQAVEKEHTDFLTGLGSRRLLFDTMTKVDCGKGKLYSGLAMVDVDDFKLYNDTFGHQKGDECLRKVGRVFLSMKEASVANFYRYGGEEFVGLLYSDSEAGLRAACDSINAAVRALAIPHANENGFISVSIGLALRESNPDEPTESYEHLLHKADLALYEAKRLGKNRTVTYQASLEQYAQKIDASYHS